MSDFGGWVRDIEAMFQDVEEQVDEICEAWMIKVSDYLVLETPGPGNQYYHTRYIATGRRRQGYMVGLNPPASTTLMGRTGAEDQDDRANATRARLATMIRLVGLHDSVFIWNEVGYGVDVHEGLNKHAHIGPRKFTLAAQIRAPQLLEAAKAEVKGRAFG